MIKPSITSYHHRYGWLVVMGARLPVYNTRQLHACLLRHFDPCYRLLVVGVFRLCLEIVSYRPYK